MLHRSTIGTIVLVCLFVVSTIPTALGGGGLPVANGYDTGGNTHYTSGSLSDSTITVTRGDTVEITFSHSGPATLYVGGEEAGYKLAVDVNGSGTSTIAIDTYGSVSSNADTYVTGGDPTLLYPEDGLEQSLVPTSYTLNLTVHESTENGTVRKVPQDLGLLVIEERPPMEVEANVAPTGLDLSSTDASGVSSASTPRRTVAKGDYAVIAINASGLGSAIDPDDLDGDAGANGVEIHVEDLYDPPNKAGDSFYASDRGTVNPVWDEEHSRLLLVWDTEDVELYDGRHRYNLTVRLREEHNDLLTEDSFEDDTTITVVEPRIELDSRDGLTVYPWESNVTKLRGTTNVAPGSTFEFRAQGFEPRPFMRKTTTEVRKNGTFTAEMDLSGLARGIEFNTWVFGHREAAEWNVAFRNATAEFDLENQTVEDGDRATVRNVSLSVGGFLVLENRTGSVVSVVPVNETRQEQVAIDIEPPFNRSSYLTAKAYMDWNRNGSFEPSSDRPYQMNGTNVSDRAVVFVPETGEPRPSTGANVSNNTAGNATTTVTTLSVVSKEPLTPGKTGGNAGLSIVIPVLGLLAALFLVGREAT